MSLFPKAPFGLSAQPIYVARIPAAPFAVANIAASAAFNSYFILSSVSAIFRAFMLRISETPTRARISKPRSRVCVPSIQRVYAMLRCLFFEGINGDCRDKSRHETNDTSGAFIEVCRSRLAKRAAETQNSRLPMKPRTPLNSNFAQLQQHDEQLLRVGMLAERYFTDDPNTSLLKLRQLAEGIAQITATYVGIYKSPQEGQYQATRAAPQ